MAIGKRFKKKMQNPVAGNSYWRIWGWPIKPENHVFFKDDPTGVIVDGVWVQLFFSTVQGTARYGRGRRRLAGTVVGYYRTRKQAEQVLQEIKDGKHPGIFAGMREHHEMLDDLEKCLDDYIDESYLDQDELVETPVQQLTLRAVPSSKTLHQHFVERLQEHGMFEKQAEEVMQLYWKSSYATSADLAYKPTDGYDEMLFGLLWMGIRAVALEYINTNCPLAWFKAVFDDNDPIHQQLADKKKKESQEADTDGVYRSTNKHGNDQYWIDGKEVCVRCNEPYVNKALGVECDQCQKEQSY